MMGEGTLPDQGQMMAHLIAVAGPTEKWHGNCFGLATHLANYLKTEHGIDAVAVYGHYLGFVSPDGYWGGRTCGFQQHGWVYVPEMILDPTRWSFENEKPYVAELYRPHSDYDEGGNKVRQMLRVPFREAAAYGKPLEDSDMYVDLTEVCREHLEGLAHQEIDWDALTTGGLMWLANCGYDELDLFRCELYEELSRLGVAGYIPYDNQRRHKRETGDELSTSDD